jgi:hypothetical protein
MASVFHIALNANVVDTGLFALRNMLDYDILDDRVAGMPPISLKSRRVFGMQ